MKHKYKFRGQAIKTGEYVYGDLIHPWADDQVYPSIRSATDYVNGVASLGYYAVDPDSVTQLVGYYDGKEVYRHDVFTLATPEARPVSAELSVLIVDAQGNHYDYDPKKFVLA